MKRWWDHGGTTWKCVIVKPQVPPCLQPLQSNFGGYCSYPWNRVHRPSQQKCQDLATNIFEILRWCVRYIVMSTCVLTSKNLRNANMGIGETIVWKASLRSSCAELTSYKRWPIQLRKRCKETENKSREFKWEKKKFRDFKKILNHVLNFQLVLKRSFTEILQVTFKSILSVPSYHQFFNGQLLACSFQLYLCILQQYFNCISVYLTCISPLTAQSEFSVCSYRQFVNGQVLTTDR